MASTPPAPLVRPYNGVAADERIAARRERLLAAGLECYGTNGYAASGVKDVSRQAGLTHRYFYESFEDREALFLAVFDRRADELFKANAQAVSSADPNPEAQLRASATTFLTSLADDPRKVRILFLEPAAVGPRAEQHTRTVLRNLAEFTEATARDHLPDGISDGTVKIAARSIVATLWDVAIEWQQGTLTQTLDEMIDNCVVVLQALLDGLSRTLDRRPAPEHGSLDAVPGGRPAQRAQLR